MKRQLRRLKSNTTACRQSREQRTKTFELIFINDGGTDGSSAALSGLVQLDGRVRVEESTKSKALSAGFALARNDYIVALDPGPETRVLVYRVRITVE